MSYDFWGAWDGELGMNAPLYARSGLTGGKEKWSIVSFSLLFKACNTVWLLNTETFFAGLGRQNLGQHGNAKKQDHHRSRHLWTRMDAQGKVFFSLDFSFHPTHPLLKYTFVNADDCRTCQRLCLVLQEILQHDLVLTLEKEEWEPTMR